VGESLIQSEYVIDPTDGQSARVVIVPPYVDEGAWAGLFVQLVGLAEDTDATFSVRVLGVRRGRLNAQAEILVSRTDGKPAWASPITLLALWTVVDDDMVGFRPLG
jgi:hypothetical protein